MQGCRKRFEVLKKESVKSRLLYFYERKFFIGVFLFFLIEIFPVPFSYGAARFFTDIGIKTSYLSGYTLYHISYYEGASGIESELEFPLRTYLLGIEGAILYKEKSGYNRLKLTWEVLTNIDSGSGKLKDSDWLTDDIDIALYGIAHPGKDIYSESDIELDAFVFNINMLYNFYNASNFTLGPLIGYRHQDFRFIASNVNQIGYGPYSRDYTGFFPDEALHYKVRYDFIYGGIGSEFSISSVQGGIILGTGYVHAEDRDNHILRAKLSEGETSGYGLFMDIHGGYSLINTLFLKIKAGYLKFHTTGTQHQYFYRATPECPTGGCSAYVSDRIDSEQWDLSLSLIYRFK